MFVNKTGPPMAAKAVAALLPLLLAFAVAATVESNGHADTVLSPIDQRVRAAPVSRRGWSR